MSEQSSPDSQPSPPEQGPPLPGRGEGRRTGPIEGGGMPGSPGPTLSPPRFGEMIRGLSRYIRPHFCRISLAIVLAACCALLNLPNIHLVGEIVYEITRNDAAMPDVMPTVRWMLWALLGVFVLRHGLSFVRDFTITRVNESVLFQVRLDIFRHLTRLSPSFYERRLTGGILAQTIRDAGAVNAFIMAVLVSPLVDILTFLACIVYGFYVSPILLGVVVALVPLYVIIFKLTNGKMMSWSKRSRDEFEGLTGHLTERLTGMQEIQLFNNVQRETAQFATRLDRFRSVNVMAAFWQGLAQASSLLLNALGPLAVLWVSVVLIREGHLNIGDFMKFYGLLFVLYMPVSRFIEVNSIYRMNVPSLAKVLDFLQTPSDVSETQDATSLALKKGQVAFDGVDFAYGKASPVLRQFTLHVASGEQVGLVGPSACGKSTVLKLLVRFMDVRGGAVRLDGTDLRDVTLSSLRDAVGMVSQVPFLFKTSVRENILYGRPDAPFEDVQAAARAANIHDEIEKLPHGYETDVGERGAMLSGGQRQRIAIARVLLKGPRVLLLDEATSALDTESERLVQEAIDRLTEGRTCLIVAHRLSTLANCDRIVVLNKGRIVEEGTMEQLLKREGLFARLWEMQSSTASSGRGREGGDQ